MSRKLVVLNPDHCMEVQFDQQITIGRDVFNSLSLQDPEVSRSHAIIFEQDGEVLIKDLRSRNGIFVRGEKTTESVLRDGDEIILGSTVLIYNPSDTLDPASVLSKRGRYLIEKQSASKSARRAAPATIFSAREMEDAVATLFSKGPDSTEGTFFTHENAIFLLRLMHEMNGAPEAGALCERTLTLAVQFLGGHHGVIMETDEPKQHLKVRALFSKEESDSIRVAQPILKILLGSEKSLFCPDVAHDRRFENLSGQTERPIHSFVATPIRSGDVLFGIIYIDSEDSSVTYDFAALRTLYLIADQLGALMRSRPLHFPKHPVARQQIAPALGS